MIINITIITLTVALTTYNVMILVYHNKNDHIIIITIITLTVALTIYNVMILSAGRRAIVRRYKVLLNV